MTLTFQTSSKADHLWRERSYRSPEPKPHRAGRNPPHPRFRRAAMESVNCQ
jgi:hypothetical protein